MQSILSLNRSLNGFLDADDLGDSKISEEPFDDSAGFRPIKPAELDAPRTPSATPPNDEESVANRGNKAWWNGLFIIGYDSRSCTYIYLISKLVMNVL